MGSHAQCIVVARAGLQAGGALGPGFQLPSQSVRMEALCKKQWGGMFGEGHKWAGPVALKQSVHMVRSGSGAGLAPRRWLMGSCQTRVEDLPSHPPCLPL